jgi:hypothetical protein
MVRDTVIGISEDEFHPTVEEELLDSDLVVFRTGRAGAPRVGRWSSARALRLTRSGSSEPEDGTPILLRSEGLALLVGGDDPRTSDLARSVPDPVVVVVLAGPETGHVEATVTSLPDCHRFTVERFERFAVRKIYLRATEPVSIATSTWHHAEREEEAESLALPDPPDEIEVSGDLVYVQLGPALASTEPTEETSLSATIEPPSNPSPTSPPEPGLDARVEVEDEVEAKAPDSADARESSA